jgi:hypothetical protein
MTRSRDLANLGDITSTLENQGLTLISTTTFSAVASQSINDVFSATYDNYFIQGNFTPASDSPFEAVPTFSVSNFYNLKKDN